MQVPKLCIVCCFLSLLVPGQEAQAPDRGVRHEPSSTPPASTESWSERHDYALLFASNEYDSWQPLINPIPDAEAIAQELKDNYGFQTELVRNATRERVLMKLREYSKKSFKPSDQLFIFRGARSIR
jgi:Caspase domain